MADLKSRLLRHIEMEMINRLMDIRLNLKKSTLHEYSCPDYIKLKLRWIKALRDNHEYISNNDIKHTSDALVAMIDSSNPPFDETTIDLFKNILEFDDGTNELSLEK